MSRPRPGWLKCDLCGTSRMARTASKVRGEAKREGWVFDALDVPNSQGRGSPRSLDFCRPEHVDAYHEKMRQLEAVVYESCSQASAIYDQKAQPDFAPDGNVVEIVRGVYWKQNLTKELRVNDGTATHIWPRMTGRVILIRKRETA